jgi:hypothetical protein
MLRKISSLGTALNATEQKSIQGGYVDYDVEISGNWDRGDGVTCYCDGMEIDCGMAC